jgi:hypothetical protein
MLMVATFLVFLIVTSTIIFTILLLFLSAVKELIKPMNTGPRAIIDRGSSTEKTKNLDD